MFRKLLVPVDVQFRPRSTLRVAAKLANAGAELTLLYVAGVARELEKSNYSTISVHGHVRHELHFDRQLRDIVAVLSEYGATAEIQIAYNSPIHRAINFAAWETGADAILMGTHGRRGLQRALHGSITEEVMRESDVPVIVIRESAQPPSYRCLNSVPNIHNRLEGA